MRGLPMRCPGCGLEFEAPVIGVDQNATKVRMIGSRTPCPRCGNMARQIEDGEYEVDMDGTWRSVASALAAPGVTRKDYEDLAKLLRSAQVLGLSPEEVGRQVQSRLPRFAAVGSFLRSNEHLGTWIGVLVAVLAIILGTVQASEPKAPTAVTVVVQQPTEKQIRAWIEEAVIAANRAHEPPKTR
jgi:hypothetical protein